MKLVFDELSRKSITILNTEFLLGKYRRVTYILPHGRISLPASYEDVINSTTRTWILRILKVSSPVIYGTRMSQDFKMAKNHQPRHPKYDTK